MIEDEKLFDKYMKNSEKVSNIIKKKIFNGELMYKFPQKYKKFFNLQARKSHFPKYRKLFKSIFLYIFRAWKVTS